MQACDFGFCGRFEVECVNPDGSVAWREAFKNGTTTAGLTDILNVHFAGGAQKSTWYLGLINSPGFSSLSAADTMASHAGWSENTGYSGGARPTWSPGTPAGGVITNPTSVNFTMTGIEVVKGAFLVSDPTLGGTSGVLWATGVFDVAQSLAPGQILRITYTCTATGS